MTAEECQRRAEEAKALAAQTQDLWERETLLRIATQWQLLASHRAVKEGKPRFVVPLQLLHAIGAHSELGQSLAGKTAIRQSNSPTRT